MYKTSRAPTAKPRFFFSPQEWLGYERCDKTHTYIRTYLLRDPLRRTIHRRTLSSYLENYDEEDWTVQVTVTPNGFQPNPSAFDLGECAIEFHKLDNNTYMFVSQSYCLQTQRYTALLRHQTPRWLWCTQSTSSIKSQPSLTNVDILMCVVSLNTEVTRTSVWIRRHSTSNKNIKKTLKNVTQQS